MLRDEVLALLKAREGKPLSGEEMSRALGVSRAAVWKAMESLRDEGYRCGNIIIWNTGITAAKKFVSKNAGTIKYDSCIFFM